MSTHLALQDDKSTVVIAPSRPRPLLLLLLHRMLQREKRLVGAMVLLLLLEYIIPYGTRLLYPLTVFTTWIHECCHGIAAILVGGYIEALYVYPDGSGLAYTWLPKDQHYDMKRAFVSCSGYMGTALTGGILLWLRRTRWGPRLGTASLGSLMVLSSCSHWFFLEAATEDASSSSSSSDDDDDMVRTVFVIMGTILLVLGCGVDVMGGGLRETVFAILAAACGWNSMTSIHGLLGSEEEVSVNGQGRHSDAATVSLHIGMPHWFWAAAWFGQALGVLAVGLLCPLRGEEEPGSNNNKQPPQVEEDRTTTRPEQHDDDDVQRTEAVQNSSNLIIIL